jgi:hypothetical protein
VQPKVVEVLDALNESDTLADMHSEVEKSRFLLRTHDVPLRSPVVLERAAAHILRRKGELLAVEPALSDLEDIDGHHQVRIATKRIRYTMEICVPAFGKQLDGAIGAVKKVQSLLGDVHDCDVWVRNLTTFIEEERNRTVEYFGHARPFHRLRDGLEFLRDERARHGSRSLPSCSNTGNTFAPKGSGRLEALLQRTARLQRRRKSNRGMSRFMARKTRSTKIALLSDIHGNLPALEAVLEDAAQRRIAGLWNLGDMLGYAPFPNEVLRRLREVGAVSIVGNYDRKVLDFASKAGAWKRTKPPPSISHFNGTTPIWRQEPPPSAISAGAGAP